MDLFNLYKNCRLCPKQCGVDRTLGQVGFCGQTAELKMACVALHKGEEPPVSGQGGSGAFFFSGCTLKCSYCQNWQISRNSMGKTVSLKEFARLCLLVQEQGGENINLVTATHFIPSVIAGLELARAKGLKIPVVWNSSGYEDTEAVKLLFPYINIWLADLKTLDQTVAEQYLRTRDYPQNATAFLHFLLGELRKQRGKIPDQKRQEDNAGERNSEPFRGWHGQRLLIRHLFVPGETAVTEQVLNWFDLHAKGAALLSLMTQYCPPSLETSAATCPSRFVSEEEYNRLIELLDRYGIDEGFIQEPTSTQDSQKDLWLPDFNRNNPFPTDMSRTLWHWQDAGKS